MADEQPIFNRLAMIPNDTYNYSNSDIFYSLVNYNYLNYYRQVIQKCQQWLDGYVPNFHIATNGIFSTRIGAKITKGITNQIFGRGLVFVNGKKTQSFDGLNFISHEWVDKCDFQNVIKQVIGYAVPLGTSCLKLNKSIDGELWCEALRNDYFYFSVDAKNKLTDITTYIRTFQSTNEKAINYCLVERRYFKRECAKFIAKIGGECWQFNDKTSVANVPYVKYEIFQINSTSNNNTLAANSGKGIPYKSLPSEIKEKLKENYSTIKVDEEQRLPFNEHLGCVLFKNEGGDITHPSLPFGSPMLFDLISSFMAYDTEMSCFVRDVYNSKGVVGLPKNLTQSSLVGAGASQGGYTDSPFAQLNLPGYELINGVALDEQKPIITQFEIRSNEHEQAQNLILKTIATSVGMSPRVIASYLVNGNEKTAEETHSEDDTITQWVKTHRQDYIQGLNEIIELVLSYYGKVDNVEVRFANDGLMSTERQIALIKEKLDLGLIDLEDAVREIYPDLDEQQLQTKVQKAKAQREFNQQKQQTEFDEMYGDELKGTGNGGIEN